MKKEKKNIKVVRKIFKAVSPFKTLFILTLFFSILLAIISTTKPILIGKGVDWYIQNGPNRNEFFKWFLIMLGIVICEGILTFIVTYLSNFVGQSVIKDLRIRLFKKMIRFKMKYFDKTSNGVVITRLVSDIEAVQEIFSNGILSIFTDMLKIIFYLIVMFYTSWELSLLILIPIPLMIIATKIFARLIKNSLKIERLQVSKLNAFVQEHITGISVIKIFNMGNREIKKFKKINENHKKAHLKMVNAYSVFFPVVEIFSAISIAFLVLGGIYQGKNSIAVMVEFILFVNMLYRPIRQMADKFNVIQRGAVRAERVFELLETNNSIKNGSVKHLNFNQKISINNLSFAYEKKHYVLKNINLSISPGQKIAFVGATGSGKTTLINLLSRFYNYNTGSIKIGDTELKNIDLTTLRKNVGVVIQDVFLFSDSIFNNIVLGDNTITREQVIHAAKSIGVHDFIMKLPKNYNFIVSERGESLSVGQRQLISFIRAYIYNPKILILDEATSSIDSESEELIKLATKEITKNRTSIIIAHRLSTIQHSDTIVVLENGEIIEQGNHNDLLLKEGQYKLLYDLQIS